MRKAPLKGGVEESSVNKLNVILLLLHSSNKGKDILLEAICLSHEWTFFPLLLAFCWTSLADTFHSREQCHRVHIYNILKRQWIVCFGNKRNKMSVVMNILPWKMWHSSFVEYDCCHKFSFKHWESLLEHFLYFFLVLCWNETVVIVERTRSTGGWWKLYQIWVKH